MKHFLLSLIFFCTAPVGLPCTTFVFKDSSHLVFGRNLDWVSDKGIVVVNQRNVKKKSLVFPPEKSTEWTSKYGSITFNQFGKEFPFGGMNEKGLVVELMLVDGEYPRPDDRTTVNELQWIQYQLDNASTLNEVIASDRLIRISKVDQNLHFLVCDQFGQVAAIEFNENGMQVYRGKDLPITVLENDTYTESMFNYNNNIKSRFLTAANMINDGPKQQPVSEFAFKILDKVALSGSWSIVYDIKHKQIKFKTASNKTVKILNMNQFSFSCQTSTIAYDMNTNHKGDIAPFFSPLSTKLNTKVFNEAIKSNDIYLPSQILKQFRNYHQTCQCSDKR